MIPYFDETLRILGESLCSMAEDTFQRMVAEGIRAIESGHKIVVSGLGKNVPICEKFVGSMVSLGMAACFLHTNSAVHGDMGIVKEGDMVILLTKSGETWESVYLAGQLEGRNIDLWLLTFNRESTLAKRIENSLALGLRHEGDMWNVMPNNSTTIYLIVLQGLAMQIAEGRGLNIEDFKRNHPGGHIGELLRENKTALTP